MEANGTHDLLMAEAEENGSLKLPAEANLPKE
jgi:hypothetical protein